MPKRVVVRLTDDQMCALCDLVAAGDGPSTIAAAINAPYFTVHKAAKRVRECGWATKIAYSSCVICGRLVVQGPPAHRTICRDQECQRQRIIQRSTAWRAEHPGYSTPYAKAWAERNPEKRLADRITSYDYLRGKPQERTPEQKSKHNAIARRGQAKRNEATLETATEHKQPWSSDDDAYVIAHPELTNAAISLDLGRTAQAVHGRRTTLRKRGLLEPWTGL